MNDRQGLKILFAGTPEFAATHLQALIKDGCHQLVGVYTQPDRPAGRGKKLRASPVKELALNAGIPVEQPSSLKTPEAQHQLAAYGADIMVVVAYGLLLPLAVLEIPKLGCINVHASLLPRWRGAAPIQRAIEAGDSQTGITIMQMDVGLDTGHMLHKVYCSITEEDSAESLHDKLATLGPKALLDTLDQLAAGTHSATAQDNSLATYAHKLDKAEAQLDWHKNAVYLDRQIRAFNPFPVAFTPFADDRLRILEARIGHQSHTCAPGTIVSLASDSLTIACGEGTTLALTKVQLPGKKAMSVRDVLNGSGQLFHAGLSLAAP